MQGAPGNRACRACPGCGRLLEAAWRRGRIGARPAATWGSERLPPPADSALHAGFPLQIQLTHAQGWTLGTHLCEPGLWWLVVDEGPWMRSATAPRACRSSSGASTEQQRTSGAARRRCSEGAIPFKGANIQCAHLCTEGATHAMGRPRPTDHGSRSRVGNPRASCHDRSTGATSLLHTHGGQGSGLSYQHAGIEGWHQSGLCEDQSIEQAA